MYADWDTCEKDLNEFALKISIFVFKKVKS